jgi:hypothetical protein
MNFFSFLSAFFIVFSLGSLSACQRADLPRVERGGSNSESKPGQEHRKRDTEEGRLIDGAPLQPADGREAVPPEPDRFVPEVYEEFVLNRFLGKSDLSFIDEASYFEIHEFVKREFGLSQTQTLEVHRRAIHYTVLQISSWLSQIGYRNWAAQLVREQRIRFPGSREISVQEDLDQAWDLLLATHEDYRARSFLLQLSKNFLRVLDPFALVAVGDGPAHSVFLLPHQEATLGSSLKSLSLEPEESDRAGYWLRVPAWHSQEKVLSVFKEARGLIEASSSKASFLILDLRSAAGISSDVVDLLLRDFPWDAYPILVWVNQFTRGAPELLLKALEAFPNIVFAGQETMGYSNEICESDIFNAQGKRSFWLRFGCSEGNPRSLKFVPDLEFKNTSILPALKEEENKEVLRLHQLGIQYYFVRQRIRSQHRSTLEKYLRDRKRASVFSKETWEWVLEMKRVEEDRQGVFSQPDPQKIVTWLALNWAKLVSPIEGSSIEFESESLE